MLNIELVNDNLKKFDQACDETLLALEKEPEADLLEGIYHRQLDKPTLMLNVLALYHASQTVVIERLVLKEGNMCVQAR